MLGSVWSEVSRLDAVIKVMNGELCSAQLATSVPMVRHDQNRALAEAKRIIIQISSLR